MRNLTPVALYWGLRDYGTGQWTGGDETCDHKRPVPKGGSSTLTNWSGTSDAQEEYAAKLKATASYERACAKCGARRVDSQLGLEATPTQYVENMVNLFREVWRVLRDDGTLWVNLGDSYVSTAAGCYAPTPREQQAQRSARPAGLKPKDLVGIPWRVAFALQQDGWYLRSDIIWSKCNPMPESVTDRPTKAHEYLFLFSKQPRYFYDADAIREPAPFNTNTHMASGRLDQADPRRTQARQIVGNGEPPLNRNRRSVWTIPTQPFPEAHFATYPEELVRPCILAGSAIGDLVLDPFIGSGTTALVARKHGRRSIGIDLSESYLTIAAKRTSQLSLLGAS